MAQLRADCSRCAGLCCIALAFDRGEFFAIDKPAGTACRHLGRDFRCGVHQNLEACGFPGCARYDCLGAGQRVTQELFDGASWQEHPELLRSMLEAFFQMRQVHEAIALLEGVSAWSLEPHQVARLDELLDRLDPRVGWSKQRLVAYCEGTGLRQVHDFIRSLRPLFEARDGKRRLCVLPGAAF